MSICLYVLAMPQKIRQGSSIKFTKTVVDWKHLSSTWVTASAYGLECIYSFTAYFCNLTKCWKMVFLSFTQCPKFQETLILYKMFFSKGLSTIIRSLEIDCKTSSFSLTISHINEYQKQSSGGVFFAKMMFLRISQNLQESTCARVSFLITKLESEVFNFI